MNIVKADSLTRGAHLIEFAYSKKGRHLQLTAADYVGMIAAYIASGRLGYNIEKELGARFTPHIGARAREIFEVFDDWNANGLWIQGAATDDFRFTHPQLDRRYPAINEAHRRLSERY